MISSQRLLQSDQSDCTTHVAILCRHYFALPTNPGEQFFAFTNLATWLLTVCGKKLDLPQEVTKLEAEQQGRGRMTFNKGLAPD